MSMKCRNILLEVIRLIDNVSIIMSFMSSLCVHFCMHNESTDCYISKLNIYTKLNI